MSGPPPSKPDVLNDVGRWFLQTVDARWVFVVALAFVILFWLAVRWRKRRVMSRDEAISLGQAILSLYTAPVLFCLLVLTNPPVFDPEKKFLYQSAGFLASVFLAFGVVRQIATAWTDDGKTKGQEGSDSRK